MAGTYVGYIAKISEDEIPEDLIDEWAETIKRERSRIHSHLTLAIPNETAFINKLAEPSSAKYADFVNPNYIKAMTAKLKQRLKLRKAYVDWKAGIDGAFTVDPATGKSLFEIKIDEKKARFRRIAYPLSVVGEKALLGFNALVKGVMMITGDTRLTYYLDPAKGDSLTGVPENGFDVKFVNYVKPMLIAKGVFASIYALYANEANDISTRDSVLSEFNSDVTTVINAFKKPDYTVSLQLAWQADVGKIKVTASVTAP